MSGLLVDPRLHLILLAAAIVVGWIGWQGALAADDWVSRAVVVGPERGALIEVESPGLADRDAY